MVSNAVVAPRGSAFISERGNLTPAWHHYLAQIEGLTVGLAASFDGQLLIEIEARLAIMEEAVAKAEADFPKRNWAFYYTDQAEIVTGTGNDHCIIHHDLNAQKAIARAQDFFGTSSDMISSYTQFTNDGNTIDLTMSAGSYQGNGRCEAWVLGFYDELQ